MGRGRNRDVKVGEINVVQKRAGKWRKWASERQQGRSAKAGGEVGEGAALARDANW